MKLSNFNLGDLKLSINLVKKYMPGTSLGIAEGTNEHNKIFEGIYNLIVSI